MWQRLYSFIKFFLDSPEIDVDKRWVHGGVGYEAVISCLVYGDPEPQVRILISCLVYGDPEPQVRILISCLFYGDPEP